MLPHIIFRNDDADYFPGPTVWWDDGYGADGDGNAGDGADGNGNTGDGNGNPNNGDTAASGISQPPVLASIVAALLATQGDTGLPYAAALFDGILRWHRWWHTARTPRDCAVVCAVHPWETGRDNSPDWEVGLDAVTVADLPPYQRKDISHADPAQRPSDAQYDKYISIIRFGRRHGWAQKTVTNEGPFLMADPGIFFILLRADRDLLNLAIKLNRDDCVAKKFAPGLPTPKRRRIIYGTIKSLRFARAMCVAANSQTAYPTPRHCVFTPASATQRNDNRP